MTPTCGAGGRGCNVITSVLLLCISSTRWVIFDHFHAAMHERLTITCITVKIPIWVDTPKTGDLAPIDNFY